MGLPYKIRHNELNEVVYRNTCHIRDNASSSDNICHALSLSCCHCYYLRLGLLEILSQDKFLAALNFKRGVVHFLPINDKHTVLGANQKGVR